MKTAKGRPAKRMTRAERALVVNELETGPQVDQRRDDIMRRMLASPPKPHVEMKVGKRLMTGRRPKD